MSDTIESLRQQLNQRDLDFEREQTLRIRTEKERDAALGELRIMKYDDGECKAMLHAECRINGQSSMEIVRQLISQRNEALARAEAAERDASKAREALLKVRNVIIRGNTPRPLSEIKTLASNVLQSDFVSRDEFNAMQTQRDQALHLLSGGTLTEQQVKDSGLGHGVLSEQRHHEAMRCKAEKQRAKLAQVLKCIYETGTAGQRSNWDNAFGAAFLIRDLPKVEDFVPRAELEAAERACGEMRNAADYAAHATDEIENEFGERMCIQAGRKAISEHLRTEAERVEKG